MSAIFMQRQNSQLRDSKRRREPRHAVSTTSTITECDGANDMPGRAPRGPTRMSSSSSRLTQDTIPEEDDAAPVPDVEAGWPAEERPSLWTKLRQVYERLGLRHFVPCILLLVYSIVGALVFSSIEQPRQAHHRQRQMEWRDRLRDNTSVKIEQLFASGVLLPGTKQLALRDVMLWYERELLADVPLDLDWDIWGGLFYVGTIYTTIGYGNIKPTSGLGRYLTILYAMFGVPLVLAILTDLGKLQCHWANVCWQRLRGRRDAAAAEPTSESQLSQADPFRYDSAAIPLWLALVLCFGWMFACAGLFLLWEDQWTYPKSFYFFFISLSTIGLGDIIPQHPRIMVVNFVLIIIGLSLVTMVINVIQIKIEEWLYHMLKMIQAEYEAALLMEEGPDRDKILQKIMRKQPWYMRKIMPSLMTDRQIEQFEQKVEQAVTATYNTKLVQAGETSAGSTERGVQTAAATCDVAVDAPPPPSSADASAQTADDDAPTEPTLSPAVLHGLGAAPLPPPDEATPPPSVATQTSVRALVDKTCQVSPLLSIRYRCRAAERAREQATQTVGATGARAAATQTLVEHVKVSLPPLGARRRPLVMGRSFDSADSVCQTEPLSEGTDRLIQTNDSYLKIARKLEALRTNRTDSLAVMAATPVRRKSNSEIVKPSTATAIANELRR